MDVIYLVILVISRGVPAINPPFSQFPISLESPVLTDPSFSLRAMAPCKTEQPLELSSVAAPVAVGRANAKDASRCSSACPVGSSLTQPKATTTQLDAVANAKEFDLQGKDGDDEISDTSGPPNPLSELEPQNTGSQQADPLNGPVDVIATLDLLYFFTGIEQPTQGGLIILKQGPPPPKVCKLCSEKYGFDKSMLPGVARYIYGPTTANTNLRRHLYQAHAEEYDKAVLEYKWTYKLSSKVGNASTHAARASRSCR
ncbi:hypothetical protein F5888DRAFT_1809490 [Russula emetica]|nr:hypothetical protein F5888DRAFT_1809490 [Russula emetica]